MFCRERDTKIELLRIIGIYFVILTHSTAFGIRNEIMPVTPADMTGGVICNYMMNFPGTVFNIIFILITGYLCAEKTISYRRVFLLFLQLCFYTLGISLIVGIIGSEDFSVQYMLHSAVPFISGSNWFINCYIIFSLFIPIINKGLGALAQKEHLRLILLLFALRCASAVLGLDLYVTAASDLELFLLIYVTGAYIRVNTNASVCDKKEASKWFLYTALITVLYFLSAAAIGTMYRRTGAIWYLDHIMILHEPAKICAAICLFIAVLHCPSFKSKTLNRIASLCPGVYMIHENHLIRPLLWTGIFPLLPYLNTWYFIPAMLIKAAAVMAVCLIIDMPWTILIRPRIDRLMRERKQS